jgi:hypothetical protein
MQAPGESRERLVQRLNAAYAGGLISDQTLALRLDQVLQERLVDSGRIVGDLQLRAHPRALRERLSQTVTTVLDKLDGYFDPPREETLLALDWTAPSQELIVGRGSRCDIGLTDTTVSRRHARLVWRDGGWVLQDLGSKNGTYLNGRRVGRCQLRPGDRLALGQALLRVD